MQTEPQRASTMMQLLQTITAVFSLSDAHIRLPMVVFVGVDLDRFPSRATALFCRAGLGDCNNGLMYLRPLSFLTIV